MKASNNVVENKTLSMTFIEGESTLPTKTSQIRWVNPKVVQQYPESFFVVYFSGKSPETRMRDMGEVLRYAIYQEPMQYYKAADKK